MLISCGMGKGKARSTVPSPAKSAAFRSKLLLLCILEVRGKANKRSTLQVGPEGDRSALDVHRRLPHTWKPGKSLLLGVFGSRFVFKTSRWEEEWRKPGCSLFVFVLLVCVSVTLGCSRCVVSHRRYLSKNTRVRGGAKNAAVLTQ